MKPLIAALLALSFPATVWAAPIKTPAKTPATSKSRIDPRGVAALDKAAAYYQKQRSFAVTATETVMLGRTVIRSSRLQIGLQAPYRASLKVTSLDEKGQPEYSMEARLMNAKSTIVSVLRQPATTEALAGGVEARQKATVDMFRQHPGVLISLVLLAAGENPASGKDIKSVRVSEVREKNRALQSVTIVRQAPGESALTAEFRLSPATHTIEKVIVSGPKAGKDLTVATTFGPLVSNWKGSQSATDAAIYNWNKFAPDILLASAIPATKIAIDPKARAIFARALKLYGTAQGLSVRWKAPGEFDEPAQSSLEFDRAGRLRLASDDVFEPLIVFDGKERWELDKSQLNEREQVQYTRESADESDLTMELAGVPGVAGAIGGLLSGIDALAAERIADNSDTREFRATLLPAQPFGGQACDLVRITAISGTSGNPKDPLWHNQQTFWFARTDGRVMRFQERSGTANEAMSATDSQIIAQTFDPKFAPNTFKFTPPKGAVLSKDGL